MDILTLSLATRKALWELGVDVETTQTEIMNEKEMVFTHNYVSLGNGYVSIVPGFVYIVKFDGKQYICNVSEYDGVSVIGNADFVLGTGDNGMPFLVSDNGSEVMLINVHHIKEGETHTFGISVQEETIHPIDPKFLPGVCLPVVELETVIPVRDEEPVPLSESENLVLDKMMESFTPFVLKCKLTNGFNFANLAYLIDTGTIKMVGVLGDIIPGFMNIGDGSGWVTAE